MKILGENSSRTLSVSCMILLLGGTVLSLTVFSRTAHAANAPVGIAIPLYTYPTDGSWAATIQAKQANPNVPFIAVINPNSGPGSASDSNYVQGIKNLQAAGITVLGYVATGYGSNAISSDEAQVASYHNWYGVNGIFFDEMSNLASAAGYYSTLNSYVHSLIPGSTTMGNPGTSVPTGLIGTLDVLIVYESSGYPAISFVTYGGYSPTNFGTVSYGTPLSTTFLSSLSGVNSWVYATDANLPNPYDVLPSYFTSEVATLSIIDGSAPPITSPSTTSSISTVSSSTGTSPLTVSAQDTNGAALTGYYMALHQNGQVIATGFSPTTFTLANGQAYTVESDGYGPCVFAHWLDTGSTNPFRSISISGATAITSVLNCGSTTTTSTSTQSTTATLTTTTHSTTTQSTTSVHSTTSSTSTQSTTSTHSTSTTSISRAGTATITVNSDWLNGTPFNGIFVEIQTNGVVVYDGFTHLSYTGTIGSKYTVTFFYYPPYGYGNVFLERLSTGNTGSSATITLTGTTTVTAYYLLISCPPTHPIC